MPRKLIGPFIFLILAVFLFKEPLFNPQRNLAGIDFKLASMHWDSFEAAEMKLGRLPLWNPFINSGQPYLAHPVSAIFYPTNILYLFSPVHYATVLIIVIHLFMAAIGMERLAYYFVKDRYASFIAGVIFSLSGYMMAKIYAGHLSSILSAAYFPLVFLSSYIAVQTPDTRSISKAAVILALLILAGFPENTAYIILSLVLVFFLLFIKKFKEDKKRAVVLVKTFAFIVGLAFLIDAVQLLPSLEFVGQTTRAQGMSYEESVSFSLTPEHLKNLISPNVYRQHLGSTYPLWEYLNYFGAASIGLAIFGFLKSVSISYAGLIFLTIIYVVIASTVQFHQLFPLPSLELFQKLLFSIFISFALVYVFILKSGKKVSLLILSLAILGMIGFILSFGEFLPFKLYRLFWQYIPLFKLFRVPSHYLLLTLFSLSFLAAYGLAKVKFNILKLAISILITVDFLSFGGQYILTDNQRVYPTDPKLETAIQKFDNNYRFYHSYGAYTDWSNLMSLFDPNAAMSQRIESLKGSDTLLLKSYADLASIIDGRTIVPFSSRPIDVVIDNYNSPLLDLLSTRYFLMLPYEPDLSSLDPERFRTLLKTERFNLYENVKAMPKGTMIYKVITKANNDSIASYMRSFDFKYDNEVVVDEKTSKLLKSIPSTNKAILSEVNVLSRSSGKTMFEVETASPGVLLTSDLYYPGWKAKLNGKQSLPIIRVDYALSGIIVPAGKYRLDMYYLPESLIIGAIITLLAVSFLGIFIFKKR